MPKKNQVRIPKPQTQIMGRNKACSCGSGKKFKKCCEPLQHQLAAKITALDFHIQSEIKKILIEAGIDHKDKHLVLRSRKADHTETSEIYYHLGKFDILKVNFLSERILATREQRVNVINSEFDKLVSFENLMVKKDEKS
ncbi:MAG: hypothetical protein KQ78_02111 [Candidatus Izimaplasma bacterium HR2]|nr:MAG: hypothetical protein KQ78_02111 [Candidatus Izimaplasma bacterium HR2]